MRVLMIGDVVGRPGRQAVRELLPGLREELDLDFVVANGENSAGWAGITRKTLDGLLRAGVDVVTSGNHVYRYPEILPLLDSRRDELIRPANHSGAAPGTGFAIREDRRGRRVGVLNLQGRVFMDPSEDPFAAADEIVSRRQHDTDAILVDLHAEATSEKVAMGWFLDGRVAVVAGTHTHVPTADARILPEGTAHISDIGMTGPHHSCLGVETHIILKRFRTGMPQRFDVAKGDVRLQAVLIDVESATGRSRSIERIERSLP